MKYLANIIFDGKILVSSLLLVLIQASFEINFFLQRGISTIEKFCPQNFVSKKIALCQMAWQLPVALTALNFLLFLFFVFKYNLSPNKKKWHLILLFFSVLSTTIAFLELPIVYSEFSN